MFEKMMIETSGSTSSRSNHITDSLRVLFPGTDYSSTLKVEKVGYFDMMVFPPDYTASHPEGRKPCISHHTKIMSDNKKFLPLVGLTSANR